MTVPDHAQIHVRCVNDGCPDPADTTVTFHAIAPGVLTHPLLVCAGCGNHLREEAMPTTDEPGS